MRRKKLNNQAEKILDQFARKPAAGWIRRKQLSQLNTELSLLVTRKLENQD